MHRSKLPEAEPHRLGCRVVLYYTSGSSHQRAAFWIRASHRKKLMMGRSPDLVILEDILHSLNCFLSSGLDISDKAPRKRKLGRRWLLDFSSCYSTTAYPPSLNTSWGTCYSYPGMTQYHHLLRRPHNTILLNSHKESVPPVRIK